LDLDIVVCAKNQAAYLNQILKQITVAVPFKNLIVVYGTSKDNTKQVAEKYTKQAFWDGDRGLGAARALGMTKASSEIVAMVDADVILAGDWYERLICRFSDSKTAAVMGTCVYGYGCKPLEAYWEYIRRTEEVNYGCQNTMFRRRAVLEVGNFDATIRGAGEDYDLYLRLQAAGYTWLWEKQASAYHPMTMNEYIKHVSWWTRGRPYVDEVERWAGKTSVFRVHMRQMLLFVESLKKAEKLSMEVHPTFLVYWPAISLNSALITLSELKKRTSEIQLKTSITCRQTNSA
jgi:cellulose synthase/poly-beta-1,6-N-acetylglucosamine synthase-like glycosyltransferase